MGSAGVAESVSQPAGVATPRGILQLTEGVCPCPAEVAHGCLGDLGASDRGESPRARPPGAWPGIAAVGLDPLPGLCGKQRGGPPAGGAVVPPGAGAPGAPRARCRDEEEGWGWRWQRAEEVSAGTLAGTPGSQGHDLGAVSGRHRGHRAGLCVDLHAEEECGRLRQSGPPTCRVTGFLAGPLR
jgi:hypothetical protein